MKTQIQSIHFDADENLQDFIHSKIDSLNEIYNKIESCDVILKQDKNNKNKNKVVEIIMNIPGNRLFAKNQTDSFEASLELVIEEIRSQLNKHKNKIADRNSLGLEVLQ